MDTADRRFEEALAHHKEGRASEALGLYAQAIDANPDHYGALFNMAALLASVGRHDDAASLYARVLEMRPGDADVHCNLGNLRLAQGDRAAAAASYARALDADPSHAAAHVNLGKLRLDEGRTEEALASFRAALAVSPALLEAYTNAGIALIRLDRLEEALSVFEAVRALDPDDAQTLRNTAAILERLGRFEDAIALFESHHATHAADAESEFQIGNLRHAMGAPEAAIAHYRGALDLDPTVPEIHNNLATVLVETGRDDEALECLGEALRLRPDFPAALNTMGNAHAGKDELEAAAACYARAFAGDPSLAVVAVNGANVLRDLGRLDEALAGLDSLLASHPELATAHNARGLVLQDYGRQDAALAAFERALGVQPTYHESLNNRAISLQALGRHDEALSAYRDALTAKPELAEAHFNIGHVLQTLGRNDEAVTAFQQALALKPDLGAAYPFLAHALMYQCSWSNLEAVIAKVIGDVEDKIAAGKPISVPPFGLAATPASPALRLAVAREVSARTAAVVRSIRTVAPAAREHERGPLRVGYVSPDFREHSVAAVFRSLLEAHGREGFTWYGYSISPRQNLSFEGFERTFDVFADLGHASLRDALERIAGDGIDILIDLAGHTRDTRLELFALRPAPVQAHYLGYGATIGADYIPYLITDPVHTPPELAPFCSESLVYLPDSFMVGAPAEVAAAPVSRAKCGLPEDGFVLASFNAHYKFHLRQFAVWMRLLKRLDGAVLWLREGTPAAQDNLRRETEVRGVAPERLVFAPRTPRPEHLARHRLADLALDTMYHAGGVTTIDALWVGVPVITLAGEAHSARTGASILAAIGLDDAVTDSLDSYEQLAFELATDTAALAALKAKLARNRVSAPLFDPSRLARYLEIAYRMMWERHASGQPPATIHVPRLPA